MEKAVAAKLNVERREVVSRPRILLLITNLDFGGAQRVFHYQSEMFATDYDVVECVFNLDNAVAFPGTNKLLNLDVKAGKNFIDKFFRFWQRVNRLKKIKRDRQIDICISHLEGADLVNVLSQVSERTLSWVHGSKRYDLNISGWLGFIRHRFLIPYIFSKLDLVITVSAAIKQELVNHYHAHAAKVKTVYNLFDVKLIKRKADELLPEVYTCIFGNRPVLLFSGRLAAQKNLEGLIRWYSDFSTQSDSILVILGDGDLRNETTELCTELRIPTYNPWSNLPLNDSYKIYFLGFQDNPYPFVKRADIFLLPSLWEGFPMVLGEAMACGVAIVSADCPTGPREMLCDIPPEGNLQFPYFADYGVLMPLLNKQGFNAWTKGIKKLLEDRALLKQLASKSSHRGDFFELEKNTRLVLDLVKSLIHEKAD